jgi:pimeloyl-ACP methyl ester carboxylesterase
MEPLARMLVQAGFPPENIHKADYPLGSNLATTVGVLSQAIRSIMDRYPSTTKFDIIGHSMGHAAGLHAIMAGQTGQRVRKFIGIAGVAFGQAAKPMPCFLLPCGDMFDFLIPFKSQNVMQFMMTHQAAIDQLDKCSIFSPQDGSLNPFDAGAFPDGRNISLPQVGHLRAISSPAVMNALITECYGGTLD